MGAMIWGGAALAFTGVLALVWCILYVLRLRRAGLDDATLRARMQIAVIVNFAALGVSTLGLMLVVAGIFLR
ncbi:MAG: hypothetical protein JJU09_10080 [Rhodobacteraceae bacterium]|nr:hypothetical protein [Paracoccaceae bacterium]TVR48207.1 MAG: hypothetical protein EA386_05435 [Paracoccaceae bacterium]